MWLTILNGTLGKSDTKKRWPKWFCSPSFIYRGTFCSLNAFEIPLEIQARSQRERGRSVLPWWVELIIRMINKAFFKIIIAAKKVTGCCPGGIYERWWLPWRENYHFSSEFEAVEKHEGKSATRESDRNPSGIINALLIVAGIRQADQGFFLVW